MSTPIVEELAALATRLATGAADRVPTDAAALALETKSTDTDLVTSADRAVEAWLRDAIAAARPDDAVLGEEGDDRPGRSGVRWILDPIDGTVNFVLGIPAYAVSVAAELDGQVVAGAVANPVTGELFRAALGGGAFLDGRRLTGPRPVPVNRMVVGTGFGYEPERRRRQLAVLAAVVAEIADIRRIGAASLDLCAVAAGRLDGYFEVGLNPWDYAAGALIAAEAGARVWGVDGGPPSTALTAAAGPVGAEGFATLLRSAGAEHVLD